MVAARLIFVAALAAVSATSVSAASLVTTPGVYTGPSLNLSAYQTGQYNFTFGPVNVGPGLTFTGSPGGGGNSGQGSVVGQGGYGLGGNGTFGGDAVYIGVDSGTGFGQITFASVQTQFYGFWNYAPGFGDDATLSTLDSMGNVIDSFNLVALAPISTPGGFNEFAFRGIESSAGFHGIRFGGNFILLAATTDGSPVAPGIPEPASWAMLIAGFGLVGATLRRRRVALAS